MSSGLHTLNRSASNPGSNGRMTEGERLARMFEMCEFQEALQTASVRSMYPEADARELFLRVAERRLGPELTRKAYGWSSE